MHHPVLRPFVLLALTLPAIAFAQTSTLDKIKQSGIDDARLSRVVDPVLVPRRRCPADRLRLRDLREDRRPRQDRDRPQRPQDAVPGGDLGEPHPAAAERHHRHRVRLDHQQQRARQAGRLRDQLLLHRHALPGEDRHQRNKLADLAGKPSSRPPARPTTRSSASSTRTRSSASTCSAPRTTPSRR